MSYVEDSDDECSGLTIDQIVWRVFPLEADEPYRNFVRTVLLRGQQQVLNHIPALSRWARSKKTYDSQNVVDFFVTQGLIVNPEFFYAHPDSVLINVPNQSSAQVIVPAFSTPEAGDRNLAVNIIEGTENNAQAITPRSPVGYDNQFPPAIMNESDAEPNRPYTMQNESNDSERDQEGAEVDNSSITDNETDMDDGKMYKQAEPTSHVENMGTGSNLCLKVMPELERNAAFDFNDWLKDVLNLPENFFTPRPHFPPFTSHSRPFPTIDETEEPHIVALTNDQDIHPHSRAAGVTVAGQTTEVVHLSENIGDLVGEIDESVELAQQSNTTVAQVSGEQVVHTSATVNRAQFAHVETENVSHIPRDNLLGLPVCDVATTVQTWIDGGPSQVRENPSRNPPLSVASKRESGRGSLIDDQYGLYSHTDMDSPETPVNEDVDVSARSPVILSSAGSDSLYNYHLRVDQRLFEYPPSDYSVDCEDGDA